MYEYIYKRWLEDNLKADFGQGRCLMLLGPRQVGKTTIVAELLAGYESKSIARFSGDDFDDLLLISEIGWRKMEALFAQIDVVFVDEAQKVANIGNFAKLFVDNYGRKKQLIITGSSSLNLLDRTAEPLTGRKFLHHLYPLHFSEVVSSYDQLEATRVVNDYLVYGLYPAVVNSGIANKKRILGELASSYLYKDVLEFQAIKNPSVINRLLKLLAYQIGSEVSYNELAGKLGIDAKTVEFYVDLLEKNFIVFRLNPIAKNPRRSISKLRKVYFWDIGIRNSLIDSFEQNLDLRVDLGQIWENFLIAERLKALSYAQKTISCYFWRTYDGAEVDFVEEFANGVRGYEFKWKKHKMGRISALWSDLSAESPILINRDNFLQFITLK